MFSSNISALRDLQMDALTYVSAVADVVEGLLKEIEQSHGLEAHRRDRMVETIMGLVKTSKEFNTAIGKNV